MPGIGGVGGGDLLEEASAAIAQGEGQKSASAEMQAKCLELSQREDLYELLSRSLAPSLYAMEDVKKGLLLQLFGGTNKSIERGGGAGGPRYRGDINVLLVGDPGTAKSQILGVSGIRLVVGTDADEHAVCAQVGTTRCIYIRQGFICSRSDSICHSGSRFQAACAREVCRFFVGTCRVIDFMIVEPWY